MVILVVLTGNVVLKRIDVCLATGQNVYSIHQKGHRGCLVFFKKLFIIISPFFYWNRRNIYPFLSSTSLSITTSLFIKMNLLTIRYWLCSLLRAVRWSIFVNFCVILVSCGELSHWQSYHIFFFMFQVFHIIISFNYDTKKVATKIKRIDVYQQIKYYKLIDFCVSLWKKLWHVNLYTYIVYILVCTSCWTLECYT